MKMRMPKLSFNARQYIADHEFNDSIYKNPAQPMNCIEEILEIHTDAFPVTFSIYEEESAKCNFRALNHSKYTRLTKKFHDMKFNCL